jgi:uncharacterized membrane protein YbhN (UPF0104 family)
MQAYRPSKRIIMKTISISILNQFILLCALKVLSSTANFTTLSSIDYLFALTIGQIACYLPITPGGIGIGEATFASILLLLNPGVTDSYATIYLILRCITYITYLPGMALGLVKFR